MLEFKRISWRNFMSYGDYDNSIELDSLGECLITGEILDDDSGDKSNGAGKSTIPNAIQWCLFGRTMHSPNPGDKIINFFSGKPCVVELEFKNGDKIRRTRNYGNTELYYMRRGDESSSISNNLSTAKNQQLELNRVFGLDWDIFCGSVFFNQYGRPWLEMADQSRKKVIERLLNIDKFIYYAKVAKSKYDSAESKLVRVSDKLRSISDNIVSWEAEIKRIEEHSSNFENDKKDRINKLLNEIKELESVYNDIPDYDIGEIKKKWDVISKIESRVVEQRKKISNINYDISKLSGECDYLMTRINKWREKAGKECVECGQLVPDDHVSSNVSELLNTVNDLRSKIANLEKSKDEKLKIIAKAESVIESRRPDMTVDDVTDMINKKDRIRKNISELRGRIDKIKSEKNPYDKYLRELKGKVNNAKKEIDSHKKESDKLETLSKHLFYIYKSYNDRSRIRSYIFNEHVPYINERLNHYLDVFGLDVRISLTDSLGVSSNLWGYDFESGGERKRTDVAFMLAMFDFHEVMYGRQSNILVLDEVDGRLDDDGIESLISIIKDDLSPRVDTVMVISHRNMMFDMFSNEIRVVRQDRYSSILEN